jgi:hypothetical protein
VCLEKKLQKVNTSRFFSKMFFHLCLFFLFTLSDHVSGAPWTHGKHATSSASIKVACPVEPFKVGTLIEDTKTLRKELKKRGDEGKTI